MQKTQETWVRSLGQEDDPGRGNGNSLQYSCLENPMDSGAWQAVQSIGSNRVGHDLSNDERMHTKFPKL